MAYSAARLTLYALISAMEEDLRSLVVEHLAPQRALEELLDEQLLTKARSRFERDLQLEPGDAGLDDLVFYLDFGELYQVLNHDGSLLPNRVRGDVRDATPQLERLVPIRNRVAHTRPLQFDDLGVGTSIAEHLAKQSPEIWRTLCDTLHRLAQEPSFVLGLEIRRFDLDPSPVKHNLPVPDFDETGFVGRDEATDQLVRLCLGAYPVISLVAEGGTGKSALALKVAYDLLDRPDFPFEAVVWTTAKAAHLTPNQILNIEGAIQDSLGLLAEAVRELGGETASSEPLEEILEYLQQFRILLILDNLETVMDDPLRRFLERLPAGSKILITSRIGLGAFDYPVKLAPLDTDESIQLLRAVAGMRGVKELVRMPNDKLADYCSRMQNNPGFIKWFVSAVQVGRRPEEVLAKTGLFLDFCLSNVYNYLDSDAHEILEAMVSIPTRLSQPELAYVLESEILPLQEAIQQLLATNMMRMESVQRGGFYETYYALAELSRLYLLKHHPVSAVRADALRRRSRRLTAEGEALEAKVALADPYAISTLHIETRAQRAVAGRLTRALNAIRRQEFEIATADVEASAALTPGYSEVYRVAALIALGRGDVTDARSQYETALELAPDSAPLRKWFGGFLLRYEDDRVGALREFEHAARLDERGAEPRIEIARVHLWNRDWGKAREIIDELLGRLNLSLYAVRMTTLLSVQWYVRRADAYLDDQDYRAAIDELEKLRSEVERLPAGTLDTGLRQALAKGAITVRRSLASDEHREDAVQIYEWLRRESIIGARPLSNGHIRGQVVRVAEDRGFGFVRAAGDGKEYFFHRNDCSSKEEWADIAQVGTRVRFLPGKSDKGLMATEVGIS